MRILTVEPVTLDRDDDVKRMFTLSPFVWREDGEYAMLLRCLPHEEDPALKISSIYYGRGKTRLRF